MINILYAMELGYGNRLNLGSLSSRCSIYPVRSLEEGKEAIDKQPFDIAVIGNYLLSEKGMGTLREFELGMQEQAQHSRPTLERVSIVPATLPTEQAAIPLLRYLLKKQPDVEAMIYTALTLFDGNNLEKAKLSPVNVFHNPFDECKIVATLREIIEGYQLISSPMLSQL